MTKLNEKETIKKNQNKERPIKKKMIIIEFFLHYFFYQNNIIFTF
jgi:hypothetical protein